MELVYSPYINGCFNWMILNLYIGNGCFTKHPSLNGCLGFQVIITSSKGRFSIATLVYQRVTINKS